MYLSDLKEGDIFYLVSYNGWTITSIYKTKVEYYKHIKSGRMIHYLDEHNTDCCFKLRGEYYLDSSLIIYSHSNFYKIKCFLNKEDVLKELDNFKTEFNNRYNNFLKEVI